MADPIPGAPAPAPEPVPVAAPVVAPAAPEPAPAPAPAPTVSPDPAASPAPAEAASPAPVGAEPTKPLDAHSELTLLEQFDADKKAKEAAAPVIADPTKPVEAPKLDADGKPIVDPAAKPEPVVVAPIDYKYELPPTLTATDEERGQFKTALDTYRADPTNAQPLIDLHNEAMTKYAEKMSQDQHKVWNDTRKDWRTQVMADPVIGGSGFETSMNAIGRMRDMFVAPDRAAAFENFLRITGAGDHPEFLHMMRNVARKFDEPGLPPTGANPPPNNGKPPGRGRLYDHPTSQPK